MTISHVVALMTPCTVPICLDGVMRQTCQLE